MAVVKEALWKGKEVVDGAEVAAKVTDSKSLWLHESLMEGSTLPTIEAFVVKVDGCKESGISIRLVSTACVIAQHLISPFTLE